MPERRKFGISFCERNFVKVFFKSSVKIHSDISVAETLPSSFYRDNNVFEKIKQNIFLKSWQFIGDNSQIKLNNSFMPQTYLTVF